MMKFAVIFSLFLIIALTIMECAAIEQRNDGKNKDEHSHRHIVAFNKGASTLKPRKLF